MSIKKKSFRIFQIIFEEFEISLTSNVILENGNLRKIKKRTKWKIFEIHEVLKCMTGYFANFI